VLGLLCLHDINLDHGKVVGIVQHTLTSGLVAGNHQQIAVSARSIQALIRVNMVYQIHLSAAGICELLAGCLRLSTPLFLPELRCVISAMRYLCHGKDIGTMNTVTVSKFLQVGVPDLVYTYLELYIADYSIVEDTTILIFHFLTTSARCLSYPNVREIVLMILHKYDQNFHVVYYVCRLMNTLLQIDSFSLNLPDINSILIKVLKEHLSDAEATTQVVLLMIGILKKDNNLANNLSNQNIVGLILSVMQCNPTSPIVLSSSCLLLKELSSLMSEAVYKQFNQFGGCQIFSQLVRDFMTSSILDSKLVLSSLIEIIYYVTGPSPLNQRDFGHTDIITHLLSLLSIYQSDARFISIVCLALGSMASYPINHPIFSPDDTCSILARLLHYHLSAIETVRSICGLLRNISCNPEICRCLLENQLFEYISASVLAYADKDRDIIGTCCQILKYLVNSGLHEKEKLSDLLRSIMTALVLFEADINVLTSILAFVVILAENSDILNRKFFSLGTCQFLQNYLRGSFLTRDTFIQICHVVRALSSTEDNVKDLISSFVISELILKWDNYRNDSISIAIPWLQTIISIGRSSCGNEFLSSQHMEQIPLFVLHKHADNIDILVVSLLSVEILSLNSLISAAFGEFNLCELLYSYLLAYDHSIQLIISILSAMTSLSNVSSNQLKFLTCGTCTKLLEFLNQNSSPELSASLYRTIASISHENDAIQDFFSRAERVISY
jgi:hypothetical protein